MAVTQVPVAAPAAALAWDSAEDSVVPVVLAEKGVPMAEQKLVLTLE